MADIHTRQYRPISNLELSDNDALSVRAVRDLQDSINNAKQWVFCHKIRNVICFPAWSSYATDVTDEKVIAVFAPADVPMGYWGGRIYMGLQRTDGSGSTTWKLYALTKLYTGSPTLQTAYLGSWYYTASIVCNSDSHAVSTATILLAKDSQWRTWFLLTATNESGTKSKITTIDIVPRIRL